MGFLDQAKNDMKAQAAGVEARKAVVREAVERCPAPKEHYQAEVNKNSINMDRWQQTMAARFQGGYRLAHVFEQNGNTVMVWEHHFHG